MGEILLSVFSTTCVFSTCYESPAENELYLRSQNLNNLASTALCLRSVSVKSKLRNLDSRSSHLIRYNIAVNVHRGSDVRAAELLGCDKDTLCLAAGTICVTLCPVAPLGLRLSNSVSVMAIG
jgi:hypothetical protein